MDFPSMSGIHCWSQGTLLQFIDHGVDRDPRFCFVVEMAQTMQNRLNNLTRTRN